MIEKTPDYIKPSWFPFSIMKFHFLLLKGIRVKSKYVFPIFLSFTILIVTGIRFFLLQSFDNWTILLSCLSLLSITFTFYSYSRKYLTNRKLMIYPANEIYKLADVIEPSLIEKNEGYRRVSLKFRRDSYLMSESVNEYLRNNCNKIQMSFIKDEKQELLDGLNTNVNLFKDVLLFRHFKSRRKGSMFFNDKKISLKSTLSSTCTSVDVYESSYYISYLTNDLATFNIDDNTNKLAPEKKWRAIDKFPYVQGNSRFSGRMKSLEESMMSNHIGGNTIAFTEKGTMIIWRQGPTALRSVGLLAPTGSGSLDFSDYENIKDKNLCTMIARGMEREFMEESQKKGSEMRNFVEKTKIIGYYRWIGKAGLPGFFGVTKLNSTKYLTANTNEVNTKMEFSAENLTDLKKSIKRLETEYEERLSVPLAANIKALKQVIAQDPGYIDFIFPK